MAENIQGKKNTTSTDEKAGPRTSPTNDRPSSSIEEEMTFGATATTNDSCDSSLCPNVMEKLAELKQQVHLALQDHTDVLRACNEQIELLKKLILREPVVSEETEGVNQNVSEQNQLETKVNALKKDKKDLIKQNMEVKRERDQKDQRIISLAKENTELKRNCDELNQKHSELQRKYDQTFNRCRELESSLDMEHRRHEAQLQCNQTLIHQCEELQRKCNGMVIQIQLMIERQREVESDLQSRLARKCRRIEYLSEELAIYRIESSSAQESTHRRNSLIQNLQQELTSCEETIEFLQNQVRERDRLATHNITFERRISEMETGMAAENEPGREEMSGHSSEGNRYSSDSFDGNGDTEHESSGSPNITNGSLVNPSQSTSTTILHQENAEYQSDDDRTTSAVSQSNSCENNRTAAFSSMTGSQDRIPHTVGESLTDEDYQGRQRRARADKTIPRILQIEEQDKQLKEKDTALKEKDCVIKQMTEKFKRLEEEKVKMESHYQEINKQMNRTMKTRNEEIAGQLKQHEARIETLTKEKSDLCELLQRGKDAISEKDRRIENYEKQIKEISEENKQLKDEKEKMLIENRVYEERKKDYEKKINDLSNELKEMDRKRVAAVMALLPGREGTDLRGQLGKLECKAADELEYKKGDEHLHVKGASELMLSRKSTVDVSLEEAGP